MILAGSLLIHQANARAKAPYWPALRSWFLLSSVFSMVVLTSTAFLPLVEMALPEILTKAVANHIDHMLVHASSPRERSCSNFFTSSMASIKYFSTGEGCSNCFC